MSDQPEKLPSTVAEAVHYLLTHTHSTRLDHIKGMARDELIDLHHGLGAGIRAEMGLWSPNEALISDPEIAGMHPDDASMYIIEQMWDTLHAQDGDTNE